MYTYKLETEVTRDHRISIDLPTDFHVRDAEVIVLSKTPPPTDCPDMSLIDFLKWLDTQPASGRSKEEIDAEIAAERDAWCD